MLLLQMIGEHSNSAMATYPCFVVIYCPRIPTWDNMITTTASRNFNTTADIQCANSSYMQQGGDSGDNATQNTIVVICKRTGQWDPPLPTCVQIFGRIFFAML